MWLISETINFMVPSATLAVLQVSKCISSVRSSYRFEFQTQTSSIISNGTRFSLNCSPKYLHNTRRILHYATLATADSHILWLIWKKNLKIRWLIALGIVAFVSFSRVLPVFFNKKKYNGTISFNFVENLKLYRGFIVFMGFPMNFRLWLLIW